MRACLRVCVYVRERTRVCQVLTRVLLAAHVTNPKGVVTGESVGRAKLMFLAVFAKLIIHSPFPHPASTAGMNTGTSQTLAGQGSDASPGIPPRNVRA